MKKNQQQVSLEAGASGGTLMGFVLGLLLGLAIAVGVAIMLTKGAPEPKLNLRAPDAVSKAKPMESIEEGEVQVEDKPNLNKPLQSKVPLPSEMAPKDPIASIAAATQGPEYWLQTGAYRNQDEAQRQKAMLAMQGLEALISERELEGAPLWRVRVGPFVGQSEVTQTRARLQSAGIPSTIIRINKSN
ncbi:SPOR domain-containing protein [Polynucleobacter sp. AM-26B4]|jgi:cell division protein FtsN|uniref:SPOR domain-containing protein n=1 Tax=Polynucleobacter sp. AM-26B4 TaxID=2689103 RepID=UPI001C0B6C22|nr:SPOR domain-containing protein [Polynucleobacter sp. AM-26B4]MBU3585492.1 SPOR domain-containing protein [Polynucleobacter sp. AM-26B4]